MPSFPALFRSAVSKPIITSDLIKLLLIPGKAMRALADSGAYPVIPEHPAGDRAGAVLVEGCLPGTVIDRAAVHAVLIELVSVKYQCDHVRGGIMGLDELVYGQFASPRLIYRQQRERFGDGGITLDAWSGLRLWPVPSTCGRGAP